MDKFIQKWAIVALLEDVDEGSEFFFTDFPLHVTLAGVFAVRKNGKQLIEELTKLLADQQSIEVQAEDKDMFGPSKDIEVMRIKKTTDLMNLYRLIHEWLESLGARYNTPQYQGKGYVPHSTIQESGFLREGEKRLIDSVSLIDLFPHGDGYQRKIYKTIDLQ